MATRTLIIDLSKGTGGEPMYGIVTVQRARATSEGTFEVLPWETKLKLHNGIATITEAVTDGSGPFYDSAYLIRVQNGYCAPRWGFMAALPEGTTPISTGDMPKVNPITGEGIYMDAQEWNALYGTLPDRVTSLEISRTVQDAKINVLEASLDLKGTGSPLGVVAAPPGTYYTDTAGTTGAWRWLKTSGTGTSGWIVTVGDTGWRALEFPDLTAGDYIVRRVGDTVTTQLSEGLLGGSGSIAFPRFPLNFRPRLRTRDIWLRDVSGSVGGTVNLSAGGYLNLYTYEVGVPAYFTLRYETSDAWPTILPGTPV